MCDIYFRFIPKDTFQQEQTASLKEKIKKQQVKPILFQTEESSLWVS